MRAKFFHNGIAVTLLIIAGPVLTANGRLEPHGHHHGDVVARILRKPATGTGSSFLITATEKSVVILPTATETSDGAGCFGNKCDPLNATRPSEVFTRITPVAQIHFERLQLEDGSVVTPSSRRRHRFRTTLESEDGVSTVNVKLASMTTDVTLPKRSGIDPSLFNVSLRANAFIEPGSAPSPTSLRSISLYVIGDDTLSFFPSEDAPTYTMSTSKIPSSSDRSVAIAPRQDGASTTCPAGNGTTYTSPAGIMYQIVCNTDYLGNDFPFQLVDSFAGCVQKCDAWNYINHHIQCIAALYVPSRGGDADDCYLKSKLENPSAASLLMEGAIRIGYATITSSLNPAGSATTTAKPTSAAVSSSNLMAASSQAAQSSVVSSSAPITSASGISTPGVTYASGDSVIVPKVDSSHLQGPSQNTPTQQYLDIKPPPGITLAKSLLTVGVNGDLSTGYDISLQTGVLEVNISTQSFLSPLTEAPHISRDGGRGGMVNGEHLFIFCDTGSYSTTTATKNGNFLGFVSSSVATDVGMKGLSGGALNLQDGIGEWSDNSGRLRGFAPLTEGEMAYNQVLQGQGQRYAIWPESDIIPLDATTGIIYAPIVYDNVNEVTKAAVFTYTGATLLTITAGGKGGPVAQRTVDKVFQQDEIEWGCSGGIRSWGPSGIGGDDGQVYLFGIIAGGILLGRTSPAHVADVNSIQYWNGNSWTSEMPTTSSTAYFISGSFMDVSVFYSPRHLTFLVVYLTAYADSTFYYRYLEADQGILPPFAPGGDSASDYVENIVKYKWSEQQVLYKAAPGLSGKYIYSGGPHLGYYGSNDISNGGSKMLLSWTAPTGLDPSTFTSEYQIVTAEIDWA